MTEDKIIKRPKLDPFLKRIPAYMQNPTIQKIPFKIPGELVGVGVTKECHRCGEDLTKLPNHMTKRGTYYGKKITLCQDCYQWVKEKKITHEVNKLFNQKDKLGSEIDNTALKISKNIFDKKIIKEIL